MKNLKKKNIVSALKELILEKPSRAVTVALDGDNLDTQYNWVSLNTNSEFDEDSELTFTPMGVTPDEEWEGISYPDITLKLKDACITGICSRRESWKTTWIFLK